MTANLVPKQNISEGAAPCTYVRTCVCMYTRFFHVKFIVKPRYLKTLRTVHAASSEEMKQLAVGKGGSAALDRARCAPGGSFRCGWVGAWL